jgi:hypothetical protein
MSGWTLQRREKSLDPAENQTLITRFRLNSRYQSRLRGLYFHTRRHDNLFIGSKE